MNNLSLLGNALALVGSILMVLTGIIKNKKSILLAQCCQYLFFALANVVLKATSGAVSNFVSLARNLVVIKVPFTAPLKILFIVAQIALTFVWETQFAWIELLPILSTVAYTLSLSVKDTIRFKKIIIFISFVWICYDFYYGNYVSFAFDILAVFSNAVGIALIKKQRKTDEQTPL